MRELTVTASATNLRRRRLAALVVAATACGTGAALAIVILSGISLPLAAVTLLVAGTAATVLVWRRLSPPVRRAGWARARAGLAAGGIAVVAYDLVRYGLVAIAQLTFWPFHVFARFGMLLVGTDAPGWAIWTTGILFHLCNGLGFAVAYVFIVRRPTWWSGLLFALALEASMLLLYPSWLQMQQMGEFVEVSIAGHVAYGLTLAFAARWTTRHAPYPIDAARDAVQSQPVSPGLTDGAP